MVVGNDLGGLLAWTMAATRPEVVRGVVALGAAHPLRLRSAVRHDGAQRRASGYALRTFQVPRRPEHLLAQDSLWVRELYDTWTGPRWRGTPGYVADVERYAEAMRIHPVYFCAAEYFRWLVRSLPRRDGRRYAESLRARCGRRSCSCTATSTPACSRPPRRAPGSMSRAATSGSCSTASATSRTTRCRSSSAAS